MGNKGFHCRTGRRQGTVGEAVQVAEPRPRRPCRRPNSVARRESRHVGLVYRDRRDSQIASNPQSSVAEQRRRCQMHYVRVESAKHAHQSWPWHTEWQRGHLREHPCRHPVHPYAVVNSLGTRFARRVVGCNDESLVAGSAKMLEHPNNRVADAVDMREERFCDDRDAHAYYSVRAGCRRGCRRAYVVRNLLFRCFLALVGLACSRTRLGGPAACPVAPSRQGRPSRPASPPLRWTPPG